MSVFYIFIILVFGYVIINCILDSNSPEEKIWTVLVDKKIEFFFDANNVMCESYVLSFIIQGKKKNFDVSYANYKKHEVNEKGTLVYKRNKFVDFIVKDS